MKSVQKYMENNWAVDDSKMDNQEWMDAYNSYDDWKPQGYENRGGDTYWADQAYQIDGNQEHYDILMSMPEEDREKAYNQIKEDVERHRAEGDHDGDDHMDGDHDGGPQGGPDGPSEAVVQAWMSGMQQDGGFDFGAAFDAAESTAKQEAQDAGEYDEAAWDECAEAGREAMIKTTVLLHTRHPGLYYRFTWSIWPALRSAIVVTVHMVIAIMVTFSAMPFNIFFNLIISFFSVFYGHTH
jgi:hypothetical protein